MNLEPRQNEALRKEIGYRLAMLLSQDQDIPPERLLSLMRKLSNMDHEPIEGNDLDPKSSIEQTDMWLRAVFVRQEQYLRDRLRHESNGHRRNELERLLDRIDETLKGELGKPAHLRSRRHRGASSENGAIGKSL